MTTDTQPDIRADVPAWLAWREAHPDVDLFLHGVDLHGVDLSCADLSSADLHGADLHSADLHGANLHGAELSGADLRSADLRGAILCGARVDGAIVARGLAGVLGARQVYVLTDAEADGIKARRDPDVRARLVCAGTDATAAEIAAGATD